MTSKQNEDSESANAPISSERRWVWALIVLILVVFAYSAIVRWPYLDDMGVWHHQWLTSFTIRMTRNWLNEGAWSDAFLMLEEPASIEFSTILDRQPYISYPPGVIIPVWATAKLFSLYSAGQLTTLVHLINLFSQLFIALALGISSFFIIKGIGSRKCHAFALSVSVPVVWLLWRTHMWWGQQVYFADQAVILPVTLLILLEVLRLRPHHISDTALEWVTTLVGFWACFTDWYGVLAVATLFLKRLLEGAYVGLSWHQRFGRWLRFACGPIVALMIWFVQIGIINGFSKIMQRFIYRTYGALSDEASSLFLDWIPNDYTWIGAGLLAVTLVCILVLCVLQFRHRRDSNWKRLGFINGFSLWIFGTCLLQSLIFWNHSSFHLFAAFKYGICFSLLTFSLVPESVLLALALTRGGQSVMALPVRPRRLTLTAIISLALSLTLLAHCFWRVGPYQEFEQDTVYDWAVEDTLDDLTGFGDVVFSTVFEVPIDPPDRFARYRIVRSAKRVYLAEDYADMRAILDPVEGDYNVCLFYPSDDPGWMSWAAGLAGETCSVEGYTLARVDKAMWLNYLAEVDS